MTAQKHHEHHPKELMWTLSFTIWGDWKELSSFAHCHTTYKCQIQIAFFTLFLGALCPIYNFSYSVHSGYETSVILSLSKWIFLILSFETCHIFFDPCSDKSILANILKNYKELTCHFHSSERKTIQILNRGCLKTVLLPKGLAKILRSSCCWQIFEGGAVIWSRLTFQCLPHHTKKVDAFLAYALGRRDEGGSVACSFIIYI